jgi:predicted GIY-YIG superfamily endonuclease
MWKVYIVYSEKINRYYTGVTEELGSQRITEFLIAGQHKD